MASVCCFMFCLTIAGCAPVILDSVVKRDQLASASEIRSAEVVRQGRPITAQRNLALERGDLNQGHAFGTDLAGEEKEALVEYLQTL